MREVVLFLLTFIFIYMLYYLFTIRKELNKINKRKKKKQGKKKKKIDEAKLPVEINYLVLKYRLDLGKINYFRFLQIMGVTTSFDLALIITLVSFLDSAGLQLVVGFFALIPILLISYHIVGKIYQKKGKMIDVSV